MRKTLLMALAVGAIATATPVPSFGHSWYPFSCCGGYDCGPAKVVEWYPNGYRKVQRLFDGATVIVPPKYQTRISEDGALHVCLRADGNGGWELLCLFDGAGV